MNARNSLITGWLLDDRELAEMVRERSERRRPAESVLGGDGVVEDAGHRIHRHLPDHRPHFGWLPRIFGGGEAAHAAPPHWQVDDLSRVVQVHDHFGGVFGLAGAAVDRRHAETGALSPPEAVGVEAARVRGARTRHVAEVAPDDELAGAVPRLLFRRGRRHAAPAALGFGAAALDAADELLFGRWQLPQIYVDRLVDQSPDWRPGHGAERFEGRLGAVRQPDHDLRIFADVFAVRAERGAADARLL